MARTFSCNEEIIVVSKGTEDIGKLAMLGNDGKFDPSVIPGCEKNTAICRVSRSAAQSIPHNAGDSAIIFDTVEFDSDSMYDANIPSRITVSTDGIYQIVSQIIFEIKGTGTRFSSIQLNGSIYIAGQSGASNNDNTWVELNSVSLYRLKKGDYIELIAFQNSGSAVNVTSDSKNGKSFLAIFKVSD